MSETATREPGGTGAELFIFRFRDSMILAGWIAGLVLVAGLLWFFTQSARNRILADSVNRALAQAGDSRQLGAALPPGETAGGAGTWFAVTNDGRSEGKQALVFTFIAGGSSFPCVAVVSPDGRVEDFIPLDNFGERVMRDISPGILRIYTRRIEGAQS